ncbi:MAG: thioether cross-link-forming SCIFF peptide maturase [Caldisericum sp.]|uniref:thioether cross-link-forming SCIFF peptide maturase n=1 Tax=Caldisericum sp. TaxID=2499687 RepID=UPI003D13AEB6
MFDKSLVHLFPFNGEFFAVDVNSGSLLNLDDATYFYLEKLEETDSKEEAFNLTKEKYGKEIAQEIQEEVNELIKDGILFSKPPKYFESNLILKSMCLNVAHSCNFGCLYCFAKKGNYGGSDALMSFDVAKAAIDYLAKNSPGREALEVDFFGGEPLLNFEVVKKTIEYAKETYKDKNWRFTITTNGSLLSDEIENFLFDNDVSIVLSLDGDKSVNDKYRVFRNGKGTFDLVFPKIKKVAVHRAESGGYYVRGTYTHDTLEISKTVMDLHNFGFKYISLEPVVTKEEDIRIKKEDLSILKKEYERLAIEYVNSQKDETWNFFHFNLDLEAGPCIQKRIHGCGAGVEYIAVSPDGSIYPCHQFDGIKETKLGDVFTGITNKELQEKFRKANFLFNKEECAKCWARFYCSGGCLANNYVMNGDIFKPYEIGCEIQKMRIEAALYVAYKLRELGIEVPTTQLSEKRDSVK